MWEQKRYKGKVSTEAEWHIRLELIIVYSTTGWDVTSLQGIPKVLISFPWQFILLGWRKEL